MCHRYKPVMTKSIDTREPAVSGADAVAGSAAPYFSRATQQRRGAECDEPGSTVAGVASFYGLPVRQVFGWRQAWRRSQSAAVERTCAGAFTPVEIIGEAAGVSATVAAQAMAVAVRMAGRGVTIELGAGASVELAEALAQVLVR
jgi:transposase-like protein